MAQKANMLRRHVFAWFSFDLPFRGNILRIWLERAHYGLFSPMASQGSALSILKPKPPRFLVVSREIEGRRSSGISPSRERQKLGP